MRGRKAFALIAFFCCAVAGADIDRDAAKRAFDAFQKNCSRDNGALWGVSLCGNVLIVEPRTRDAIGSDGWSGKLPEEIGIANTAFSWRGARWSMVRWPLPKEDPARDRLLLHERFHAIQDSVGLPASPAAGNAHLDSLEGRYLMRMEMRSLRDALLALRQSARAARKPLGDALAFRRERFRKFKDAAESEGALDRNEGMAEYTGVRLFTTDREGMIAAAIAGLEDGEKSDAFGRSYAYATGPAWGLLLDTLVPKWRSEIAHSSYEKLLSKYERPGEPPESTTVRAEEQKREEQRLARIVSYERRFLQGAPLVLHLRNMSMQFDPYDVHPFEGHGTVYEHITITDVWGKIVVTGGALISGDFKTLTVAPGGYELTLSPGWHLSVEKSQ
jgi:hypothetical protein